MPAHTVPTPATADCQCCCTKVGPINGSCKNVPPWAAIYALRTTFNNTTATRQQVQQCAVHTLGHSTVTPLGPPAASWLRCALPQCVRGSLQYSKNCTAWCQKLGGLRNSCNFTGQLGCTCACWGRVLRHQESKQLFCTRVAHVLLHSMAPQHHHNRSCF